MKQVLSKGLLSVDTNVDINHGYLYGSINNGNTYDLLKPDKCLFNIRLEELSDKDIVIEGDMIKKGRYYSNKCSVLYSRNLPLIGDVRFSIKRNENGLFIKYGKNYRRYSEIILFRHDLPERIASVFTYWSLIEKNILTLHCSAAHKNGRTVLIFAPPDTGKTQTALNLVTKSGWQYISDDILLTDGNKAYSVPYTRSGVWEWDRDKVINRKHPLSRRTKKSRMIDYLFKQYGNELNKEVKLISDITDIFIISKGEQDITKIDTNEAMNRIYSLNSLEFHNISNKHFWYSTALTGLYDMYSIKQQELSLIREIINTSNNIHRIQCLNPNEFYSNIESIIN